jgi:hypothetical protein
MPKSEKGYEAFKERMQATGDLSTSYTRLFDAFRSAGLQCPDWWEEYNRGGSFMITGPKERNGYYEMMLGNQTQQEEDFWFRWLYFGDMPRLKAIHAAYAHMMNRLANAKANPPSALPAVDHSPRLSPEGYVYILQSERRYKIGRARDLPARTKTNITSSPHEVVLLFAYKVADCNEAESELHKGFGAKRKKGEWFELDDWELDAIREYLKQRVVA